MLALEQAGGESERFKHLHGIFCKYSYQRQFKDVNYSCKRYILDAWLGPECASANESNAVLKIKARSSRQQVFCTKGILKNFTKFTGKHLYQSLY